MAAVVDETDEKTVSPLNNVEYKPEKLGTFSEADIASLDEDSKLLLNHKCKYNVGKDGMNVSFMPSPHLYDKDGKYDASKDQLKQDLAKKLEEQKKRDLKYKIKRNPVNLETAVAMAVGALKCDKIEATFYDNMNDYNNCELIDIGNSYRHKHPFLATCGKAWAEHYSLKIDVNHIWLLILQATALHVDVNAELLRKKWVMHDGKKTLTVYRNGFVKGSRGNDWAGVIDEFSDQIDKNTVKNTVEILTSDFSDSTKMDDIIAKITIMDICKNYFKYKLVSCCGFPEITLTGTKDDWIKLYTKTKQLFDTKLETKFAQQWGNTLFPVLQRFIMAFDGKIDCLFWNSMIKRGWHSAGSGGESHYSGWINVFFPLINKKWNKFCEAYDASCDYVKNGLQKNAPTGQDCSDFPNGLASAPVEWDYFGLKFKLKFIGGFLAAKTNENNKNQLTTMTGWIIGEQSKENEQTMIDMQNLSTNRDAKTAK